jgi:hypothetical protein
MDVDSDVAIHCDIFQGGACPWYLESQWFLNNDLGLLGISTHNQQRTSC